MPTTHTLRASVALIRALDAFGQRLVRVLDTPTAYACLTEAHLEGTFTAGACWPLARVVAQLLGPPASVLALRSCTSDPVMAGCIQHFVVRYGLRYLDGHGAFSGAELIRYWRDHETLAVRVDRFSKEEEGYWDSAYGFDLERPLARYLKRTLRRDLMALRALVRDYREGGKAPDDHLSNAFLCETRICSETVSVSGDVERR
jgi:hypothetical protein